MVYSYWSTAVSISSCHWWWSAAQCQAEWMTMLKGWTSLETVLSQVSQDVLLVFSSLWVVATRTLWWSSSSALLARWLKSWSLRMCTSLEAACDTSVTWRVYGITHITCQDNIIRLALAQGCKIRFFLKFELQLLKFELNSNFFTYYTLSGSK